MENKYYFQTTWENFQTFLSKGYIYPERIHNYVYGKIETLPPGHTDFDKDNYYIIGNYIPLQEDKIFEDDFLKENKTVIFEFKDLDENNIIDDKNSGKLYNGIIDFYKINKIYIQDKERLERYKSNSKTDIYIFSDNIIQSGLPKELKLVKAKLKIKKIGNSNIENLKNKLIEINKFKGGERFLKFYLEQEKQIKKYEKYIEDTKQKNKPDSEFLLIYNLLNNNLENNINDYLIKYVSSNNTFENKLQFQSFIDEISKEDDIKETVNNIKNYFNDKLGAPNYNDLFIFDINKYYGITLYLIFYKKQKLDDFLNLITNLQLNKEIIYLGIFLCGYKYLYNKLPVKIEGINLKYDIESTGKYKDKYENGESGFNIIENIVKEKNNEISELKTFHKKEILELTYSNKENLEKLIEENNKKLDKQRGDFEDNKKELENNYKNEIEQLEKENKDLKRNKNILEKQVKDLEEKLKIENENSKELKEDIKKLIDIEKQKQEIYSKYSNNTPEQQKLI